MKVSNILAIASFGISVSLVGGVVAGFVYLKNPSVQLKIRNSVIKQVAPILTEQITGGIPNLPKTPTKTGGVIPLNL